MKAMFLRAAAKHPAAPAARLLAILLALPVSCSDNPTSPSAPAAPNLRSLTVTIVPVDSEYQATAAATFSDGSSREVTREVQWTSTNTDVAVISDTGRVTPISAGATEIRGTYQTVTGSAPLTIAAPPPPPPEMHRVNVRVLDALDLTSVSDARVTIIPAGGQSEGQVGFTNRDGQVEMTAAWGGSVTVRAQRDGYESQTVQRPVTDTTFIDIRLKPLTFTLSGTAEETHTGDFPGPGPVRIEVVDGVNAGRSTTVPRIPGFGGALHYEISNLQPGTFTVRASAPRYFNQDQTRRFGVDEGSNRLRFILVPMTGEHSFQPITVNGPAVTATFFPLTHADEARTNIGFPGTAGMAVTVRITNNTVGLVGVAITENEGSAFASTSSSGAAFNLSATLPSSRPHRIWIGTTSRAGGTLLVRLTSP